MGELFTLDAATKAIIKTAINDLYANSETGGLGKSCVLVYPPKTTVCNNCVLDPIGNKSANRHKSGGPVPFPSNQPCPVCNGEGRKHEWFSEVVTLLCNWNHRSFHRPIPNLDLRLAAGYLEAKGKIELLPKIMKCDYLMFQTPIDGLIRARYKLDGEPGDPSNIIQNTFFYSYWKRDNG